MWLRASTDTAGLGRHSLAVAALTALVLCACSSAPTKPAESVSQPAAVTSDDGKPGSATAGANKPSAAQSAANGASPAGSVASVPITARGKADFDRAVGLMKAGNVTEAELEFKQVALQFPQLSSPYVNLGILYRKAGHLEQSEDALKTAVERNDGSAVAWTELGATQRLRGEFPNAAASYEKAIAADPNFAPAYRNLGVVSDLYLGDPERALTAFERYKELTGEEKPVSGWIAELRARTGKPPVKRPQPAQAPGATQTPPDQKPAEPPAAAPPPKAGG
jgi:predicted Zn-dependent protease